MSCSVEELGRDYISISTAVRGRLMTTAAMEPVRRTILRSLLIGTYSPVASLDTPSVISVIDAKRVGSHNGEVVPQSQVIVSTY